MPVPVPPGPHPVPVGCTMLFSAVTPVEAPSTAIPPEQLAWMVLPVTSVPGAACTSTPQVFVA